MYGISGVRGLREHEEWGRRGLDGLGVRSCLGFFCDEPLVVSGVKEVSGKERLRRFGVGVDRIRGGS